MNATAETSKVGCVKIEKVYASYCRENFAAITNEVAPPKLDDVISGLENHFASAKGIELVQCDICQGWSDESLKACPYCNDGRASEATAAKPAPEPSTPVVVAAEVIGVPVKRAKKEATAPNLGLLAGGRRQLTEKDLDEELEGIDRDSKQANEGAYAIGKRLIRIHDELWMLRKEDGKQKYKSYAQFVEAELQCAVGYANKLRRVAETFTKEQFFEYGIEALKALISAPKEVHEDLLRKRSQGATAAQLSAEVREIRDTGGIQVIETDATKKASENGKNVPSTEATAAGAKARKKAPKDPTALTIGLKTDAPFDVALFARPKSKKPSDPIRAREIDDQPYGEFESNNGVKIFFAVKKTAAGELFLKVTPKREEEE